VSRLRVRAFAKINLSLRVHGVRRDGYHDLTTTYQTIGLHDTLTFAPSRGVFELRCTDPSCPSDSSNLVWRAAEELWRAAGRPGAPHGVRVRLHKRIPQQAGLGGGSSDAAAAMRGLTSFWRLRLSRARAARIAASLGADVPFFLDGGTAVGRGRGDRVRLLADRPSMWVVLLIPGFGVSTAEAYRWWDQDVAGSRDRAPVASGESGNDLERAVAARRPEIARLVQSVRAAGARHAAMSGSGSTVFGLFASGGAARRAARALAGGTTRALITRTLDRARFQSLSRPRRP
jgi:4-diphosphocytidyl-2-C-methyl-D-erythritol kinase